eukprot:CAMPEP_0194304230 /NCGR_PEP_ID=MMETSP0171-20130528/2007_1 /TAXON_ID=218684 /ORGANISM="Corethron pennatum, Strain L29A3" /LENGTH=461 /DNA_ID=CAMNT_0039055431 /DNA_START=38 /DNA_END=1423 /DNA_ORIENTATION=-
MYAQAHTVHLCGRFSSKQIHSFNLCVSSVFLYFFTPAYSVAGAVYIGAFCSLLSLASHGRWFRSRAVGNLGPGYALNIPVCAGEIVDEEQGDILRCEKATPLSLLPVKTFHPPDPAPENPSGWRAKSEILKNLRHLCEAADRAATVQNGRGERKRFCWSFMCIYDYKRPKVTVFNVAYPSSVSTYYVTLVPADTPYLFEGSWPPVHLCFESSIEIYDLEGQLVDKNASINNYRDKPRCLVHESKEVFVLLRFYVNRKVQSVVPKDWIWSVFHGEEVLAPLPPSVRLALSKNLEKLAADVFARINNNEDPGQTEFYCCMNDKGLFPSKTHCYIAAKPGEDVACRGMKISGVFSTAQPEIKFVDFIAIDIKIVRTEDGIPFNEFDDGGRYEFYITDQDYVVQRPPDSSVIHIKWTHAVGKYRAVIMRTITYSSQGLAAHRKNMSPAETKSVMGCYYPVVEFLY